MAQRIQVCRDTKANWESNNPILGQGEIGLDLDGFRFKQEMEVQLGTR